MKLIDILNEVHLQVTGKDRHSTTYRKPEPRSEPERGQDERRKDQDKEIGVKMVRKEADGIVDGIHAKLKAKGFDVDRKEVESHIKAAVRGGALDPSKVLNKGEKERLDQVKKERSSGQAVKGIADFQKDGKMDMDAYMKHLTSMAKKTK